MTKNEYKVIGVMSGTSLDGIDLACVTFTYETTWKFKITCCNTVGYSQAWLQILKELVSQSSEALKQIDSKYTAHLAQVINTFIQENNIQNIDAICSHGHTALHKPEKGLTYQIGNLKELATLTNNKVVCDFRVQDVALGGQGAPLVPIGDQLLFSEYDYCLNLGGFANVSYQENENRIAYDICPVNIVLNKYANRLGFPYDDKGKIAKSGTYLMQLGNDLRNLVFYKQKPPKSLGLEWVETEIFPRLDAFKRKEKDLLRTFTEHASSQIARNFNIRSNVLVTGGGAYNDYLISRIKFNKELNIIIPSKEIIEFKEALIFGFLGVLKIREEVNCLSSVTGAKQNHSSGKIYLP
ncbi:anhydro-N-acetylmuramic acid kinase [Oceanihabitans sp. 2_MG-2023]|uniref:anhydro-N-acetylmuramic acid kinase n=1 Tax=Oceanihabitans sp. 2_MG-2023 TaxID=3062661 RepID=UPI0026E1EDE7|nr:anhydro-N-acetylmuramic acid kinase [Oceanihabitans sp. 2_MG-2023]MDO6598260.1 anhydro-N-acetylmuramic acid kinase [Oceanihabitans sp. 2_MG-2023]